MSRIVDVNGDGYSDLIVANGGNGVTSKLDSYVYWDGPKGTDRKFDFHRQIRAYQDEYSESNGKGVQGRTWPPFRSVDFLC